MKMKNSRKILQCIALTLVFIFALPMVLLAEPAVDGDYVAQRFGMDLTQAWDSASWIDALTEVSGVEEGFEDEDEFTGYGAVKNAVIAADYLELARSYPDEKVTRRLAAYGLDANDDMEVNRFVITGLDAQLYDEAFAKTVLAGEMPTQEALNDLLYDVAEAQGNTRQYLGYSDDSMIDARLQQLWDTFEIFQDETLNEIGRQAVENKLVTGFNLKRSAFDAHFDPDYTLQYGHSSLEHAHQLMVLLKSEGLSAKVQLEPKVSIYEYLLDWGPIGEPTPTYAIEEAGDDFYLAHAVEYDLLLEFDTQEEMQQFDEVVQDYAKKWEGNEEGKGLIRDSWWQPLYTALRDDMPKEDYYKIQDLFIENNGYRFHSFVLDEDFEEVKAELEKLTDLEVQYRTRYCNKAFYNYLTGDDFQ